MKLGVKAHWKDAEIMARFGTPLMEIHLEPEDLDQHMERMTSIFSRISSDYGMEMVVHNQEYWFDGEDYHLVDLASSDDFQRAKAVQYVKKALDLADVIKAWYLVVHPGGILPGKVEKEKPLARLKGSLKEIGDERMLLENMPWFYIMRNSEIWRSSICIEAEDFLEVSHLTGGMTLDICHAFLSTEEGSNQYVKQMKQELGALIKHVHASDARPPYHEGLQIGGGLVDFSILTDFNVGIIPEIINGHRNEGEGFGTALERLKTMDNPG